MELLKDSFVIQDASRSFSIYWKASQKFSLLQRVSYDSRVSTDAPLSTSSPSNNSFDMQQIAASLEDKMTIKMKQMMNEMKALAVTTPAPVKAVEGEMKPKALQLVVVYHTWTSDFTAVEKRSEVTKDTELPSTEDIQPPPFVQEQPKDKEPIKEPSFVANKAKPNLPYPSRLNKQKIREKDDILASKFMEIFCNLHFELSFVDALIHMPKFAPMFKKMLNNKDKLIELTKTPLNENCSAVVLKKLPEKLGDPGRFLIPCDFSEFDSYLALADLGASINLILLEDDYESSVQHQRRVNPKIHDVIKKEVEKLLDAGLIYPISDSPWVSPVHCVPKKGGMTVVTNEENELVLTRLVTGWRVCIDYRKLNDMDDFSVFGDSFSSCLANLDKMLKRFVAYNNPSPYFDPIVSTSSPTLTPFDESDFLLFEEADAFIAIDDEPVSPVFNATYYDPEGEFSFSMHFSNNDPLPHPNQDDYDLWHRIPEFCSHKILLEDDSERFCPTSKEGLT
ncbi:hypothetical protein Tco_0250813 [Tanacetum coccineum]